MLIESVMVRLFYKRIFSFSIVLLLQLGRVLAFADIAPDELESAVSSGLKKVEQFEFIRHWAEKKGIRAWLFGGTAAAFGHYVRWDIERQKGDKRYQDDKFDYHYSSIYRSTQDCDLVIDASVDDAEELEKLLKEAYPHLQGSKRLWEVRLLRENRDDKEALLANNDFLNQHTDSNSVGMIELTSPEPGKFRTRDLRSWNKNISPFLEDLLRQEIRFYFSRHHEETKRAKEGVNPSIIAAIRYLTKIFQFELKPRDEDLQIIKKIVSAFDTSKLDKQSYVFKWIEKNAPKMYQHAINVEYAAQLMDELGLRSKLIALGNSKNFQSAAWWLSKEPLRSQEIKKPRPGKKTARDLGITIVAHETRDFLAYESITKSYRGDPNVFISRKDTVGEGAQFGEGFYTKKGREGAIGTRITIRFEVDPSAVEGEDFYLAGEDGEDYVVFLNKKALKVIPESLQITFTQGLDLLFDQKFHNTDLGLLHKFREKIRMSRKGLSLSEHDEIVALFKTKVKYMKWLNSQIESSASNLAHDRSHLITAFVEALKLIAHDKNLLSRIFSEAQFDIRDLALLFVGKGFSIHDVHQVMQIIEVQKLIGVVDHPFASSITEVLLDPIHSKYSLSVLIDFLSAVRFDGLQVELPFEIEKQLVEATVKSSDQESIADRLSIILHSLKISPKGVLDFVSGLAHIKSPDWFRNTLVRRMGGAVEQSFDLWLSALTAELDQLRRNGLSVDRQTLIGLSVVSDFIAQTVRSNDKKKRIAAFQVQLNQSFNELIVGKFCDPVCIDRGQVQEFIVKTIIIPNKKDAESLKLLKLFVSNMRLAGVNTDQRDQFFLGIFGSDLTAEGLEFVTDGFLELNREYYRKILLDSLDPDELVELASILRSYMRRDYLKSTVIKSIDRIDAKLKELKKRGLFKQTLWRPCHEHVKKLPEH